MLAIYARVSTDEPNNHSINAQIDYGKNYATKIGLPYEIYTDNGISGTLPIEKRPDLYRLIEDITANKITHVFALDQSRLERNNVVWSNIYMLFQRENIKLHFYLGGDFNFEDDENFLTSNILSVFNAFFVKLTKRKVKKALLNNVEKGKVHAIPPYGYTTDNEKNLVINEVERSNVEFIFESSLKGIGTNKIAELLNDKGVATSYNKFEGEYKIVNKDTGAITKKKKKDAKWAGKTVQGIIKNPIYKGQRHWQGKYYPVPAIFGEAYWAEVNNNLKNNMNNSGKKVVHKYLLKGKLTCARCGRNIYGRSRLNKRDHTYICSSRRIKGGSCGTRGINIDKLEKIIWSYFFEKKEILELITKSDSTKAERKKENDERVKLNLAKINSAHSEKQNLIASIAQGVITHEDAAAYMERLKKKLEEYEEERKTLDSYNAIIRNSQDLIVKTKDEFSKFSNNIAFIEKKEIISKYIDRIYITSVKNNDNVFAVKIDFNFGDSERYFIIKNAIFSLNSKSITQMAGMTQERIMEWDDFTKLLIFTDKGILAKPWVNHKNQAVFITNHIYPYGQCKDWTAAEIINFYKESPKWLCPQTGTNANTLDIDNPSYTILVEQYKSFQEKPLEEWIRYLLSFDVKDSDGNFILSSIR